MPSVNTHQWIINPGVVCEWAVAGADGVSIYGGLADVPFENIHWHQEGKLEGLEAGSGSCWTQLNLLAIDTDCDRECEMYGHRS